MKAMSLVAILLVSFSMQLASACDLTSFQGSWQRSAGDIENADSGRTWIWNIKNQSLTINVQLTDSFGVYYETVTQYAVALDSALCQLTTKRGESTAISYRNFDEPTENSSVETRAADGKLRQFQLVISNDGKQLTIREDNQEAFQLNRNL